jgi:ACS family hexuronate transporter-like MFS transporter
MPSDTDPAPISNHAEALSSAARSAVIEKTPWLFVMVVLGSTIINFIDRQTLSVLAPTLRDEFRLSNTDYAWIINCFQIAYLVMNGVGGRLSDILGVRRGMTLFVIWWSFFSTLQAFVMGPKSLAACRFFLALGEGGNWSAAVKAVAERVPGPMRSVAVGIVNSGSSLGTAIAPPLVGGFALLFGWRPAFFLASLLGFLWLPLWLAVTRGQRSQAIQTPSEKSPSWSSIFRYRQVWAIFFGRLIGDPVFFFYAFWLPEYLYRSRGLGLAQRSAVAWIPFIAATIANVAGGAISDWLIRHGWTANRARKTVMVVSALGASVGIVTVYNTSLAVAITAISLATSFYFCWAVNLHTLPVDFFPPSYVGTVFGFGGTGSGLGTLLVTWLVGFTLDRTHSYTLVFIGIGLLLPTALVVVMLLAGKVRRLDIPAVSPSAA